MIVLHFLVGLGIGFLIIVGIIAVREYFNQIDE
jgi:hypothetical protein